MTSPSLNADVELRLTWTTVGESHMQSRSPLPAPTILLTVTLVRKILQSPGADPIFAWFVGNGPKLRRSFEPVASNDAERKSDAPSAAIPGGASTPDVADGGADGTDELGVGGNSVGLDGNSGPDGAGVDGGGVCVGGGDEGRDGTSEGRRGDCGGDGGGGEGCGALGGGS